MVGNMFACMFYVYRRMVICHLLFYGLVYFFTTNKHAYLSRAVFLRKIVGWDYENVIRFMYFLQHKNQIWRELDFVRVFEERNNNKIF